jgi:methylglutaconyl-CoA hydratase
MQTLRLEIRGAATWVWLARPEVRNAFNDVLIRELRDVFTGLSADTRVVVLSGDGRAFSAGADLEWMRSSAAFTREQNAEDAARLARVFEVIDDAPQVVVARINGAALGGAVGLIACSDVAVAIEGAKLGLTEVRLGLVPAVISPYVVRKIGESAARRFFLTGEVFDAARGRELGLIHDVVPASELDAAVEALVDTILAAGPNAVREAKRLIREVRMRDPAAAREYAVETIARLRVSEEGQEGLAAFLEKRKATWR